MKTIFVCLLVIMSSFIGGCTEQNDKKFLAEPGMLVQKTEPFGPLGPPVTEGYYIVPFPAYSQMVSNIQRTLQEIDVKVKEVKTALEAAGKKTPISEDRTIKLRLEEIDIKLSGIRMALEVVSRKIPITGDIVQIITYLRPKLNVEVDPNILCFDERIKITFNITNLSEHSVSIGDYQLTLSTGKDTTTGESLPDMNFKEFGGFYIAPGQTMQRIADIEIQEAKFEARPLYYSLYIDTETEPEIVEVLASLLFDSLDSNTLCSISQASFTFNGEISPSAFHYTE